MDLRRLAFVSALAISAGCNPFTRLEPSADAPNTPGDIGTTLPNTPTDPSIDTDIIIDSDTDDTPSDTDVPVTPSTAQIAAGADFSCMVTSAGELSCWGHNDVGQAAGLPGTFSRVDAGDTHACAIREDGTIGCWGDASGNRTAAPAGAFADLSCGAAACCALGDADGAVECWGAGLTPPAGLGAASSIAVGTTFACAVMSADNSAECWGVGEAATGAPEGTFLSVSAGDAHVCAVDANRDIVCWGDNSDGQLNVPSTGNFLRVASGGAQSCAIDDLGEVSCWGATVTPTGTGFDRVALGDEHGCGLRGDAPTCWGDETWFQGSTPLRGGVVSVSVGRLGHGCVVDAANRVQCFGADTSGRATPPVGSYTRVSAGHDHSCALRTDATAVCWGGNTQGQADVPANTTFTGISAGFQQTCGISDEVYACWGKNLDAVAPVPGSYTDLGTGPFHRCVILDTGVAQCAGSPGGGRTTVPAGQTWLDIDVGFDNTCGVNSAGAVLCWGADTDGKSTPAAGTFTRITTGERHTCAIRTDGTVGCWGNAALNTLVAPAGRYTDIDAGDDTTCAVSEAGALACWGVRKL